MTQNRKTKVRRSVAGLSVLGLFLLWMLVGWLAARALIVTRPLAQADAIVVLSGSATYLERTRYAALLYHAGRAGKIVVTNDGLLGGYSAELDRNLYFQELEVAELKRAGVPEDKIEVISNLGSSTYDEANFVLAYTRQKDLRKLIIVTSAYHSRRALGVFESVFRGSNVTLGIEGPPPGLQTPRPVTWWLHPLGWKLVPGEYLKLIYYSFRY